MAHEFPGSDWGDWLPQAVAGATPGGVDLWYLGCNGFVLKATEGTTLFIDPYCGNGDPPRTRRMIPVPFDPSDITDCDALLATHEHSDHVHGPTQRPILANTDAAYYGPNDSIAVTESEGWTDDDGIAPTQFETVAEGDTLDIGAFTVHVEPARDPDASHPVSYVIEHGSGTFFHGGDARSSEAFETIGDEYDIDLAALAFGSSGYLPDPDGGVMYKQWYADENEIAEAAAQLAPDRLLPTHWDIWKNLTADPTALRPHIRSFDRPRTLELAEIGDRVEL